MAGSAAGTAWHRIASEYGDAWVHACVPVRLLHVHEGGGAGADDGGLGVAAQRGLQDARELGVAVGDVPARCGGRSDDDSSGRESVGMPAARLTPTKFSS